MTRSDFPIKYPIFYKKMVGTWETNLPKHHKARFKFPSKRAQLVHE